MKIEKISENQIKCTLSYQDLMEREIKLSELAYGSEKTRTLFRDMMQQASYEFGFEADNIPLMIEAIPVSTETLVLVITKVEDSKDLDERLSKFSFNSQRLERYAHDLEEESADTGKAEEMLTLAEDRKTLSSTPKRTGPAADFIRIFSFADLDAVTRFATYTRGMYTGSNRLYKDNSKSSYMLVIKNDGDNTDNFLKVCNAASEFGSVEQVSYAAPSHIDEHCSLIIKDHALQVLSSL